MSLRVGVCLFLAALLTSAAMVPRDLQIFVGVGAYALFVLPTLLKRKDGQ
jgi:hypothetical protein